MPNSVNGETIANVASDPVTTALTLLDGRVSPKLRKLLTGVIIGRAGWTVGKKVHLWYQSRTTFQVTIDSDDGMYAPVQRELISLIPDGKLRSLAVLSERNGEIINNTIQQSQQLKVFYDGNITQKVKIGGFDVDVSLEFTESGYEKDKGFMPARRKLTFICSNAAGQDAVLTWMTELANSDKRKPNLWLARAWGGWNQRGDLPARSLDTVVLRKGQSEEVVEDLKAFLEAKDFYETFGLPWHRGYLFYGPPGTGKTSFARALADHFGLDVYFASLSDLEKDANLVELVSGVAPGSLLLLEDIDSLHAAVSREDEAQQITMSGLLNALDGIATPHGVIVVMTTNHREMLDDEAVLRSGRVDLEVEIGYADNEQLYRMFELFYGAVGHVVPPITDLAPSDVIEAFKRFPESAVDAAAHLAGAS